MDINCQFSNPVYWDSDTNSLLPNDNSVKPISNWQFSDINCSIPDYSTASLPAYIEQIISTSTPEKTFYFSNSIDAGQVILLAFFTLFFLFSAVFVIKKLIYKKF